MHEGLDLGPPCPHGGTHAAVGSNFHCSLSAGSTSMPRATCLNMASRSSSRGLTTRHGTRLAGLSARPSTQACRHEGRVKGLPEKGWGDPTRGTVNVLFTVYPDRPRAGTMGMQLICQAHAGALTTADFTRPCSSRLSSCTGCSGSWACPCLSTTCACSSRRGLAPLRLSSQALWRRSALACEGAKESGVQRAGYAGLAGDPGRLMEALGRLGGTDRARLAQAQGERDDQTGRWWRGRPGTGISTGRVSPSCAFQENVGGGAGLEDLFLPSLGPFNFADPPHPASGECHARSAAPAAALVMSVIPAHIMRSMGGGYDVSCGCWVVWQETSGFGRLSGS